MKRLAAIMICAVCAFIPLKAYAADVPETGAQVYVLYCPDNGEILASKNENERMKPASTTKLMTTLITLESAAKGNDIITFNKDMTAEGSSMYLKLGEQVTLRDLAVGMMMSSGNDAANAAAITIGGSSEGFAELMNERAAEIGMNNTHFVTPSGLKNADFADLTSLKSAQVVFREPNDKRVTYTNHNRLLSLYEYCIGGKTGYTQAAGRCLVSAAKKDGLTLICVTLNDKSDWDDHISLYDYGFSRLKAVRSDDSEYRLDVPLVGGESDSVPVVGGKDFSATVPDDAEVERRVVLDNFLYAPIGEGRQVGRIEYRADGELLGAVPLIAAADAPERQYQRGFFDWIKDLFTHG